MGVIDFPNSPTNGDELQAPNKFVYRWTNGNRWKNVHRPLIIPDYIWPDLSNPDNPYGTGDPGGGSPNPGEVGGPNLNGGGGDDWLLEVIDFPVNNGEATIIVDFFMNTDGSLATPVAGGLAVTPITDFRTGSGTRLGDFIPDPVAKAPFIASGGMSYGFNAMAQEQPTLVLPFVAIPGTEWYSVPATSAPDFNEGALRSWMDLDEVLSEDTKADRTQARFRVRGSGSFIGTPFTTQGCSVSAVQRTVSETLTDPTFSSVIDFKADVEDLPAALVTKTGPWVQFKANAKYLTLEGRIGGGYEVGQLFIEIDDPNAPADRNNLPVGFASNPELTFSAVAFNGTSGPVLRTMKHGNPARLTNTSYWQTSAGLTDGYLDISTGLAKTQQWTCLWFREDLAWYATVDSATPNTVESRHLYTVGDITTHSEIVSGEYDFRDYTSQTPNLGYAVTNIYIDPTGTYLYTMDSVGDIYRYTMSTAWDLGTVNAGVFDKITLGAWGATCFTVSADGYVIILLKPGKARQIIMETPWDLLSSVDSGFERDFLLDNPIDVCVSYDTGSIFVLDIPTDTSIGYRIYNYTRNI